MSWSWADMFSDSDGGSDNSYWGYIAAAASEYADSEGKRKTSKEDRKHQREMLLLKYQLEREEKEREGKLLADAYSGYSKFYTPTAAGQGINPTQAFRQPASLPAQYPRKGLMQYGG